MEVGLMYVATPEKIIFPEAVKFNEIAQNVPDSPSALFERGQWDSASGIIADRE
jgi:hypothetical protein